MMLLFISLVIGCTPTIQTFKKPIYLKRLQKEAFKEKVEIKFIDDSQWHVYFTNLSKDSVTLINTDNQEESPVIKRFPLSEIKYLKIRQDGSPLTGLITGSLLGFGVPLIDPEAGDFQAILTGIAGGVVGILFGNIDTYYIYTFDSNSGKK